LTVFAKYATDESVNPKLGFIEERFMNTEARQVLENVFRFHVVSLHLKPGTCTDSGNTNPTGMIEFLDGADRVIIRHNIELFADHDGSDQELLRKCLSNRRSWKTLREMLDHGPIHPRIREETSQFELFGRQFIPDIYTRNIKLLPEPFRSDLWRKTVLTISPSILMWAVACSYMDYYSSAGHAHITPRDMYDIDPNGNSELLINGGHFNILDVK
jgi:hypothetical protein